MNASLSRGNVGTAQVPRPNAATSRPPRGRGRKRRSLLSIVGTYVTLIGFTALFALPIVYMILGSLKPSDEVVNGLQGFVPRNLSFDNYAKVADRFGDDASGHLFTGFFLNSLIITTTVVAGGLLVNSLAGYAFARLQWRGRDTVYGLVLALIILPFEAIAVPLLFMLDDYHDTLWVQAVPFVANGLSIYLFATFFLALPRELEQAASLDGAGPWRTFFQIIVPVSKPAYASVAILTFLTQWSAYLWPVLMVRDPAKRPLPLAIGVFNSVTESPTPWGELMAFGVLMVAPVLIVFLMFQRWFVSSVVSTGTKG